MTKTITLDLDNLHKIRDINPFLAHTMWSLLK